jgi:MFS family permease
MIRDDFALDYAKAGLVVTAFSLAYGIGQLPAGWFADRIGPRLLITIGICGVAVTGLLVGLSQTFIMMLVFLALMGIAGGGYHPSAAPLISASVEPQKRGRVLGVHLVGGSASFFLAPLVAAAIAAAWGWRGAFIGLALPTAIFGVIFYVLLGRWRTKSRTESITAELPEEMSVAPSRLRHLVVFMGLTIFIQAVAFSVMSFITLFMVDHFGVGEETAAVFLSVIYSAGLWASPLGGYLSDRWGRVPVTIASCFITAPLIYLLNVVPFGPYGLAIGALLLTYGVTMYIRMPVAEAYVFGHTPERHRSTVFGIYYFVSMEAGGVLTPFIGSIIDRLGFYYTFTATSISLAVVTVVSYLFLRGVRD